MSIQILIGFISDIFDTQLFSVNHGNSSKVDYTFTQCHDDVGYSYFRPNFGIAYDWVFFWFAGQATYQWWDEWAGGWIADRGKNVIGISDREDQKLTLVL